MTNDKQNNEKDLVKVLRELERALAISQTITLAVLVSWVIILILHVFEFAWKP